MTEAEHLPAQSSVILLRICDYARRPVAEQARLNAQLDTVLALLLPAIPAKSRIVLTSNGSAAVAVLDNAPAALAFAEHALQASNAGLGLCIGIDHGPVEVLSGAADDMLAGDGVATASVMAASATEANLLATQNFRMALAQKSPGAEIALVPTVNLSDAGLRTYQVYSLDRKAQRRRRHQFIFIAVIMAGVLLASATALRLWVPERPRPFAPEVKKPAPAPAERPFRFFYGKH